jgi:hypothetical protein
VIPLPWSFSALLSDFKNCPLAYYRKRIAKDVDDPPNAAGAYGDRAHKAFEAYLNALKAGAPIPLDEEFEQYKNYLDRIACTPGEMHVECKYAISRELQPCDFFEKGVVWARAIIDVLHLDGTTARAIDHKTGKRKPDTTQLKLSALFIFIHHPEIEVVKTAYFWLKENKLDKAVFHRSQEAELWASFVPDLLAYKRAFHTMTFKPKPSGLCNGWCPVTDCEYWKPKRVFR